MGRVLSFARYLLLKVVGNNPVILLGVRASDCVAFSLAVMPALYLRDALDLGDIAGAICLGLSFILLQFFNYLLAAKTATSQGETK